MGREQNIQNRILEALSPYGIPMRINSGSVQTGDKVPSKEHPPYVLKNLRVVKLAPKGTSDIFFFGEGGKTVFIEVKIPGKDPTEEQKRFRAAMRNLGFTAGTARSVEDALNLIGVVTEK